MAVLSWISSILLATALLTVCIILPIALTVGNLYNLCAKTPYHEQALDRCTFFLGPLLMWFLWSIWSAPDWDVPLYTYIEPYFHTPLASWHMPSVLVIAGWVLVSFWVLCLLGDRLPPLPAAVCISGLEAGIILSLLFLFQLSPHLLGEGVWLPPDCFFMALFPLNYLLIVPRLMRRIICRQIARWKEAPLPPGKPVLSACQRLLSHSLSWMLAGFLLALPLLALLLWVLVLFGQAPDAVIRAFTETSDWALSQKISPPAIEYDGHYLCTVAVADIRSWSSPPGRACVTENVL